ncbi:2-succinyl-6-hydroxy-2,4-cyclohexadiene-1-carboxylate synthase [Listeria costaricensis]|uniref:2-succinyl-6-hydroxy-2, 4-cyclohexadiene-1-carboxylate synthase n=1 Tax=Listeria costaricensis TaxID=2026604 RepID=UPI000C069FD6|nr:2-succinyl-6-hydroxy-2,4-cyclohexadiene-1-carboxylate synthase [Listeria costaricensis]
MSRLAIQACGLKSAEPVVLMLHGFTGTHQTFRALFPAFKKMRLLLPDLPGHGQTGIGSPEDYPVEAICHQLVAFLDEQEIQKVVVLGYSMGGRIGTAFAATYPDRVAGLVLLGSSPGLKTAAEREARRKSDAALADTIRQDGIRAFTDRWENLSLFASQKQLPNEQQLCIRQERLAQQPEGLARSLEYTGTGAQTSYWERLADFHFPVLLITGELDDKFTQISREMLTLLSNGRHVLIPNAGHAVHLEQSEKTAEIINQWLKNLK